MTGGMVLAALTLLVLLSMSGGHFGKAVRRAGHRIADRLEEPLPHRDRRDHDREMHPRSGLEFGDYLDDEEPVGEGDDAWYTQRRYDADGGVIIDRDSLTGRQGSGKTKMGPHRPAPRRTRPARED